MGKTFRRFSIKQQRGFIPREAGDKPLHKDLLEDQRYSHRVEKNKKKEKKNKHPKRLIENEREFE